MKLKSHMTQAMVTLFLVIAVVSAEPVGNAFRYQGQLRDDGAPANGVYDMRFSLYDAAQNGVLVDGPLVFDGEPAHEASVVVTNGLFGVKMNFPGSFDGTALWLHVDVRPHGVGSYSPLTPRQAITATPFALYALDGPGGAGPWTVSGTDIRNTNSGNVGIGTDTPAAPLHVVGDIRSDGLFGITANNPNNAQAVVALGWMNDTARIRVGGNGPGASDGLDIQRTGDRSMMRFTGNGNIGIGTTEPNASLHLAGDGVETAMRISNGGGAPCTNISNTGLMVGDVCGDGRAAAFYGVTSNTLVTVQNDGSGMAATFAGDVAFNAGRVGIGTSNPATKLHVTGGSDTAPGGGGFVVTGEISGANLSIDNNEIMARNNGAISSLYLNANGGDVHVGPGDLHVGGSLVLAYEVAYSNFEKGTSAAVNCPQGKKVIGGGCFCGAHMITTSTPLQNGDGWRCSCEPDTAITQATAICVNIR